jgi:predicted phosphodiesterase
MTVRARGSPLGGVWPAMVVSVDGTVVRTLQVSSQTLTDYPVSVPAQGTHTLRIAFPNDAMSTNEDRNLVLDRVALVGAQPPMTPEGLHLGTLGDLRSSITVTWRVPGQDATQGIDVGMTSAYGTHAQATAATTPAPAPTGTLYTVSLSALAPDTLYHYRAGSPSGWSPDHWFRTAPEGGLDRETRIGVVGDTGLNPTTAATMSRLAAGGLDAVVHVGDHTYANDGSQYDPYMRQAEPVAASVPYLGVIGNHEVKACCGISSFTSYFALPGNEMWWSTDIGNVHLVVLDDEPSTGDGNSFPETTNVFSTSSPQYQWLDSDLAAAGATGRYLVVAFHRPLYSSSAVHPSNLGMRSVLEPLFDDRGVDLVVSGHAHDYERTFPIVAGAAQSTDAGPYLRAEGRIYVVTGGGGQSLYDTWQAQPTWSAVRASVFEWVELVSGTDGSLRVVAHRTSDDSVLDSFTIAPPPSTTA